MSEANTVRLRRTIAAPPSRVFRAWLEPEVLRRWLAPGGLEVKRAEVDERVGGRYRIWQGEPGAEAAGGFEAEILELVPDERIVFAWGFVGPDRESGPRYDSQLTVTLRPAPDGGTELSLVHERLDALRSAMPGVADKVGIGWEMVLADLETVMRTPTLFVCHGDDGGPRIHPCRRVQEALRAAGSDYERVVAAQGSPLPFLRRGSREGLRAATGSTRLPALKLPDGTVITSSREILAWVDGHRRDG